jgi:hypothetical protein
MKLDNVDCYLVYYDFSKIQGYSGWLVKLLGLSNITHVGPMFYHPSIGYKCITICEGRKTENGIVPNSKVHDKDELEKLGSSIVGITYVMESSVDFDALYTEAAGYTDASSWDLIFHHFIGRFIGLTRPRMCTTYASRLFGLPEIWHPANLYRYMLRKNNDHTTDCWTSKGWKNHNGNNH